MINARVAALNVALASAEGFAHDPVYGTDVASSTGVRWIDENGENPICVYLASSAEGEADIFLFNSWSDTGIRVAGIVQHADGSVANDFIGVESCTADMDILRTWLRLTRLMLEV